MKPTPRTKLLISPSWRIFFLTMTARNEPDATPSTVFTSAEINVLDQIDASRPTPRLHNRSLAAYLLQIAMLEIAMLGGYLNRNHDPPPGNMVIWRGLTRLHDIARGIHIGSKRRCG